MIRSRSRTRGGGATLESIYKYFTDDAKLNRYFTNDAKTTKYIYSKAQKLGGSTVVGILGDSLEQHQLTGSISSGSAELSQWSRSYINWWRILDPRGRMINWYDAGVTSRIARGFNNGISGNNTSQMVARVTDVTGISGIKACIVGGFTNDISTDTTSGNAAARLALGQSNLSSIYATLKAAGIVTIIVTPPPRTLAQWASGSAARQLWMDMCAWMQAQADADPTWIKIVRRDKICSADDADMTPITGYLQSDEVHLTPMGGYACAVGRTGWSGLVDVMATILDSFVEFPQAVQSGDIATNPTCTGTAGTVGTGVTGVVCTGMRAQRASGSTGVTCVASKETISGIEYQKMVFTCDGTATGGNNAVFNLDKPSNITVNLPKDGTWLQGFMQFKADASPLIEGISLRARGQPSTPANMDAQSMKSDSGLLWANAALVKANGDPLWQSTPYFSLRNGTTSILWSAIFTINNQSAGTVTIWVSRMHLVPQIDPTIEF